MKGMNNEFADIFGSQRLMAIMRGFSRDRTLQLARTAWELGIECVEIPVQSADAVETLADVVREGRDRGYVVGAGMVTTTDRVRMAAEAGAGFTVAPGFDPEVAAASFDAGVPHLPGASTASEIQAVQRFGAVWMKAFPASALGPGWFKAMHGPFPEARFVATGGMDARNCGEYLAAGATVVAVGSALEDPSQLELLAGIRQA
jgi:2-dehydro-3-deoxyphosphogluconate aldolase / (4S)-4-hydroxy-2-oxoglutarate aldolase